MCLSSVVSLLLISFVDNRSYDYMQCRMSTVERTFLVCVLFVVLFVMDDSVIYDRVQCKIYIVGNSFATATNEHLTPRYACY
jgi:hypothetical protein